LTGIDSIALYFAASAHDYRTHIWSINTPN